MRPRHPFVVLLLSLLLVGCVSTEKRYERALRHDAEGRHADAVRLYAKVLDREPAYADARARLEAAGAAAVDEAIARARAAEGVGDYEAAVRVLARLDELRRVAADVGVALAVPSDLDAYRDDLEAEAVLALVREGEADEANGRWRDALRAYERVRERYDVAPRTAAELDRARARVHVRWAEDEFARGRFRAAFERAGDALAILGPDALPHALDLQDEALAAGTRRVAFLPLDMTEAVGRALPRHVLQDLDNVLAYEHWTVPPPFIVAADPAAVHRALRRHGARGTLSPGDAADVGDRVGADWVVVGSVVAFEEAELEKRETVRAARTRGRDGVDTSYVEQDYTHAMTARVLVRVVDVRTGEVLYGDEEEATVRDRRRRGVYAGDERELALSASERRLFDRDAERRDVRALEEELVDALAPRVAARTYDALIARVD